MTLSISWVRRVGDTEELVTATDSRVNFGCCWDSCAKIFPLQRDDTVLALSGWTAYAYPLVQQAISAINMHPKLKTRALDLCELRGHLIRVLNGMLTHMHDFGRTGQDNENPDCPMLISGYSWKQSQFNIWQIVYDSRNRKFRHHTPSKLFGNPIGIVGDKVNDAKRKIAALMRSHGKSQGDGFDMEPFEVLRDFIRDEDVEFRSIGGSPQIVKTYKHMNTMPYGVFWPNRAAGTMSFMGRPMLDYEAHSFLILDPDTLETVPFMVVNPDIEARRH